MINHEIVVSGRNQMSQVKHFQQRASHHVALFKRTIITLRPYNWPELKKIYICK